jgi:hypothetical protein
VYARWDNWAFATLGWSGTTLFQRSLRYACTMMRSGEVRAAVITCVSWP